MKQLKNQIIGVLCGGFSKERAVSLISGQNVLNALKSLNYNAILIDPSKEDILNTPFDLAFNTLHGTFGEDGNLQSLLELYKIPYTGSGPITSQLCMNKLLTKQILKKHQLPTPNYTFLYQNNQLPAHLSYPIIAKPINQGSSIGIKIIDNETEFATCIPDLIKQFDGCLIEEYIKGKEVTVSIIPGKNGPQQLPILELKPKNRFYDYEAKYTPGMTNFILPAKLEIKIEKMCQKLAKQAYQLFNCKGAVRIDMIIHPEDGPTILELNTIPGMTKTSDLPAQAKQADISFNQLVETILIDATK